MTADPEQVYAQLTSGDSGRVRQLADDMAQRAHDVDEAAEQITQGLATPVWTSLLGRMAFLVQGQQAFLAAATASWRLTRGSQALGQAAQAYDDMVVAADQAIATWRQRDPALLPVQVDLLRWIVATHLGLVGAAYSAALAQLLPLLEDAEEEMQEWFDDGALRDYWFAIRSGAGRGPKIPDALLNGDLGGWAVQGLAYDPASGQYFVTSYRPGEGGDDSGLTIVNGQDGTEAANVQLASPPGNYPAPGPQHSGGVAVHGNQVYVVSSQGGESWLYTYDLADIRGAGQGASVPAVSAVPVEASSYVTIAEGNLYLGDHGGSTVYQYPLSDLPAVSNGTYQGTPNEIATPPGTNGVVPLPGGGGYVFSQNNTRDEESALITVDAQGNQLNSVEVGNMVEEIALVDGQVVGLSESGSSMYSPWDDDTGDPGDLWGQSNMFELPLGYVTDPGYTVESRTLRDAAKEFDAAVGRLEQLRGQIASMRLSAWTLGQVDGAGSFAAATNTFVDGTAQAIQQGVEAAGVAATGLLSAATEYDDADGEAASAIGLLGGML